MSPASAPRSLRGHGTTATRPSGCRGASASTANTMVDRPPERPEPNEPGPPVTVIRSRASDRPDAARTSVTAARVPARSSGMVSPNPVADASSRARCRPNANGWPLQTLTVSNTPSPTTSPWSSARTLASSASTSRPSIHQVTCIAGNLPDQAAAPSTGAVPAVATEVAVPAVATEVATGSSGYFARW